jgi:hypothetical protein
MNEHIEIYLLLYLGFLVFFIITMVFVNNRWPNFFVDNSNDQDPPVIPPA